MESKNNNMSNMFEIAKQLSNSYSSKPLQSENKLEIDNITSSQEMNMIKAAIPYMNIKIQRQLAVFIKLLEFKKTMDVYNSPSVSEISELNKSGKSKIEMLNAIKPQCSEKDRNTLDIILNILTLKNLMKNYNNFNQFSLPSTNEEQVQDNSNNTPDYNSKTNEDEPTQEELIEKLKNLLNSNGKGDDNE